MAEDEYRCSYETILCKVRYRWTQTRLRILTGSSYVTDYNPRTALWTVPLSTFLLATLAATQELLLVSRFHALYVRIMICGSLNSDMPILLPDHKPYGHPLVCCC
jgi:hypothetical protein